VAEAPPPWLATAALAAFRALPSVSGLSDKARVLAKSAQLGYVSAAGAHHAYISASFFADECQVGEFRMWGLWKIAGKKLVPVIDNDEDNDEIRGVLDIDGDGNSEILTTKGEISESGYVPWLADLGGKKPPGLGCDGYDGP
jgi:hypothetical protein